MNVVMPARADEFHRVIGRHLFQVDNPITIMALEGAEAGLRHRNDGIAWGRR